MYKGASRAMQHAHRVNQIDPSKGFLNGDSDDYIIANAGNLSIAQCEDELRTLSGDIAKANNELAVAKRECDWQAVTFIGATIATLCSRRSPFKRRINELKQISQEQILGEAIKSVATPEVAKAIFDEVQRLQLGRAGHG